MHSLTLVLYAATVAPVAVSFEQSSYVVNESSGLVNITIVTSDSPRFSFMVKVFIVLGRLQTAGDYGKFIIYYMLCTLYMYYLHIMNVIYRDRNYFWQHGFYIFPINVYISTQKPCTKLM